MDKPHEPRISPFVTHRRRRSDEHNLPRETPPLSPAETPGEDAAPDGRPLPEEDEPAS